MSPTEEERAREVRRAGEGGGANLLTSATLMGVAALIEPELLAGMAIGAGILLFSGVVTNVVSAILRPVVVGGVLRPVVKAAVKAGYQAVEQTREIIAEATEDVQDMVAEARAEH
jgi:hypothetical protein